MRRSALLALALLALPATAQEPGNCQLGQAEAEIDVGDVRAKIFTTGSLFFGNSSQAAYTVPLASGGSPIFAAGLWVGGLVDGELRVAAATYADFEYWPGPLDPATARPVNPTDCSAYDRIWSVSRRDVEHYYRTGNATPDLAEWPHDLGAPVLDGDGDTGNYDLAAGDQPAITGDQMLWWVMNDVGNSHANTLTPPIGIEVRVSAFGFGQGPAALRQSTFYRLDVVNRNVHPVEDAYVSLFMDTDLGDASDDYIGSDTTLQMGFVYNADNQDGNGSGGTYGTAPPALGVQFVRSPAGPAGASGNLSAMMYFIGGVQFPQSDPNNGEQIYYAMRGRWVDGTPLTEGGTGLNPGGEPVTTYAFAGDPVAPRFWSMRCPQSASSCGSAMSAGDMRLVASSGPSELSPGESTEILVALPFGRGETNLASVTELRRAALVILNANENGLLAARRVPGFLDPPPATSIEIRRPAPNPFTDAAAMSITLPAAAGVRVALVDVLGREVAVLADGPHEAGMHPIAITGAGLAPGVYVARVWVAGQPAGALPVTRRSP